MTERSEIADMPRATGDWRTSGPRFAAPVGLLALALTLGCTSTPSASPSPSPSPAPSTPDRARGSVSLGAPSLDENAAGRPPVLLTAEDPIDLSEVAGEVERHRQDVEDCYERRLAADPTLEGTVQIHWNITPMGTVSEQCITEDTVGDPEIRDCVNKLIADARYIAPRSGPVDVSMPFVFSARR